MSSRRVPLATVPNAANSPMRAPTAGTKRSRTYANEQRELIYGQAPPNKKQALEADDQDLRRYGLLKKTSYGSATITALTKKLEAVKQSSRAQDKVQRATAENLETIRQWQKHYRKVFPQIVFYFESIPDEARSKVSRQTALLGAVSVFDLESRVSTVYVC